jgi:hypothetical protein
MVDKFNELKEIIFNSIQPRDIILRDLIIAKKTSIQVSELYINMTLAISY